TTAERRMLMSSVVAALFQKKTAELSGGSYCRGAEVRPAHRSRHNTRPADASCALGMGIVQELLAVLSGHVERFSCRQQGLVGRSHQKSTSRSAEYDFTWDERNPQLGLYGGFAHGPTRPSGDPAPDPVLPRPATRWQRAECREHAGLVQADRNYEGVLPGWL